jgi:hypothetical protein
VRTAKRNSLFFGDLFLNAFHQTDHIRGSGVTQINDEIGMALRNHGLPDPKSFQPSFFDPFSRWAFFGIFENGPRTGII